ncbi:hypothetical protein F2Q70_00003684 [Brassica cretica]|uniref:Uncharacterized protein n=1 Tax=Brassica cretica TaxID=69181 RepID=A0A8S9J0L1_BRACR|nr:hypothetical protein F2Q70_00003684 [Brassica cretica]
MQGDSSPLINRAAVHRVCSGQVILDLSARPSRSLWRTVSTSEPPVLAVKHHTWKLEDFTDLKSLTTFGFRGEGLISLCALGNLTVETRTKKEQKLWERVKPPRNYEKALETTDKHWMPLALVGLLASLALWELFKYCSDRWKFDHHPSAGKLVIGIGQCAQRYSILKVGLNWIMYGNSKAKKLLCLHLLPLLSQQGKMLHKTLQIFRGNKSYSSIADCKECDHKESNSINNEIQTSSSSPPQFVVTTTVPNLTDLVSLISIFITTKPCHHQTSRLRLHHSSSSLQPQLCGCVLFIWDKVLSILVPWRRLKKLGGGGLATDSISEEAWLETRRQRAGDSRTEHNSCSVFSVVMRRQHSGGWRLEAGGGCSGGLRLEARGGGIRVVGRGLDFFFVRQAEA